MYSYSWFGWKGRRWDEIRYFSVSKRGRDRSVEKKIRVDMRKHGDGYGELDRAYVDALVRGGAPPMPLDRALTNLKTIHAVYRAAGW